MCGRLACSLCTPQLREASSYPKWNEEKKDFECILPTFIESSYNYQPSYNLYPTSVVPILTDKSHFPKTSGDSDYVIVPTHWGLLPSWVNSPTTSGGYHTHNARFESLLQSNLFKQELIKCRRCVILCDGYFEWQSTNRQKQPYFIYQEKMADSSNAKETTTANSLLKLAGIFSERLDEEGTKRYSCSVITKAADNRLAWLHDRMPVVLDTYDEVESWINSKKLNYQQSIDFLNNHVETNATENPNKKDLLKYHAVDKKYINDSSCKSEKCVQRINIKRQRTLDNWLCKSSPSSFK